MIYVSKVIQGDYANNVIYSIQETKVITLLVMHLNVLNVQSKF
jgi:hypothetical protein